jgi:tetratricopeptide (TPR) repeat protein
MTQLRDAMVREAMLLQRENRVPEAIDAYQRVLARWPDLADCWFNLAVLQRRGRRLADALGSYQKALDAGLSRPEEAHLNRGVIYTDYLGDHAAAERELVQSLLLNPAFVPALLNLATLYEDLGRRPDARALYDRILKLDPRCFEALARFANLQPPAAAAQLVGEQIKRALVDPAVSAAERASLGFALGRILDGVGKYAAAFQAYEAANCASRASVNAQVSHYDRARHHAFVDRIIATGIPNLRPQSAASMRPRPIFVCGMFRSGSTLTEQLLASRPGVAAGGELDFLPYLVSGELSPYPESLAALLPERLTAIAAGYLAQLEQVAAGALYVIDKRPDNFLLIGLIKTLFPEAPIVHTIRNPLDNCLSIYFLHLDQQMSYALDLMDIGHYFREYRRLMRHWKSRYPKDIFDLDYDALVAEPQPTLRRLFDFLGLHWDGKVPQTISLPSRSIKTASVWQAREPLYRHSSGRARHYRRELLALHDYLADLLA